MSPPTKPVRFTSAVAVSVSEVTTEEALATITIPAGAMGPNGFIRILATWSYTNGVNDKAMRVRFGGIAGTAFGSVVATTTATLSQLTVIQNRDAADSQVGGVVSGTGGIGTSTLANITGAVDTSAETTLVLTGQKEVGTETLTLERFVVELHFAE